VPKKELDGSQVLGAPVDQGCLRPFQCVRPIAGLTQESTIRAYWRVDRCVEL
jgi:hypothetical protein